MAWSLVLMLLLASSSGHCKENKYTFDVWTLLNTINSTNSVPVINRLMSHLTAEGFQCLKDLSTLLVAVFNQEPWAMQMIDASAKIGNAVVKLNLLWTGSYSLCLKSTQSLREHRSQYCWTEIAIDKLTLKVATCLPITCTQQYLNDVLRLFEGSPFQKVACSSGQKSLWFDPKAAFNMFLCFLLIVLLITGTSMEMYLKKPHAKKLKIEIDDEITPSSEKRGDPLKIMRKRSHDFGFTMNNIQYPADNIQSSSSRKQRALVLFSAYSNGKAVLQLTNEDDSLPFLHGLRVLSLNWIILGHVFGKLSSLSDNVLDILEMGKSKWIRFPTNDYFAVDVFQILSGFLLTLFYLSSIQTSRKISWLKVYFMYLVRIVPSFWFIFIVFHNGIYLRSDEERLYYDVASVREDCSQHWWFHVLFLSNFLKKPDKCFKVSWIMSLDVQLYFILPFVLVFLLRYRRNFYVFAVLIILGSCLSSGITSYINGFQAEYESDLKKFAHTHDRLFSKIYTKIYFRISLYVLAVCLAYLIHKYKKKIHLAKNVKRMVWFICFLCLFFPFLNPYYIVGNVVASAWYIASVHSVWTSGILLLIFLCYNGYGGILYSILSWRGWLPFSRLCYSTFLVHYFIVELAFFSRDRSCHFGFISGLLYLACVTIISYVAGLVLHLAIEAPISNLTKAIGLS